MNQTAEIDEIMKRAGVDESPFHYSLASNDALSYAEAVSLSTKVLSIAGGRVVVRVEDEARKRPKLAFSRILSRAAIVFVAIGIVKGALDYVHGIRTFELARAIQDAQESEKHSLAESLLQEYVLIRKHDTSAQIALIFERTCIKAEAEHASPIRSPLDCPEIFDRELSLAANACDDDELLRRINLIRQRLNDIETARTLSFADMTLVDAAAVPEPSSFITIIAGLTALLFARQRRP